MSKKLFVLFCILALATQALADDNEPQVEDGVLVLTEKNFDATIKKHPFILVEFYAPWCGHCKTLAPEYARAAKTLSEGENPIPLAKIDATAEKELGTRFEVSGYPTLKFFINGSPVEYNGGRTDSEIVSWLRKRTQPSTTEVHTSEEVDKLAADNEVVVIFFGDKSSSEYNAFEKTANNYEDLIFAYTQNAELVAHYKLANTNSVVLFKNFDERRNDLTSEVNAESIKSFIDSNSNPTIMEFTQKAASVIFGDNKPALFVFLGDDQSSKNAKQALVDASEKLKGKIILSFSQIKDGLGKRLADYVGITDAHIPSVRIVNPIGGEVKKFHLTEEITTDNIVRFFEDWTAGKLKPVLKSEEIPEKDDGHVRVLVGKNFDAVVLDTTKDVLVEFYAPWCGHCKSLAPIYEEVASLLKENTNVVIAKMDATANEVEGVAVQGFPTIKFYPANNKASPKDFEGDRTAAGFVKFLRDNKSVEWQVEVEAPAAAASHDHEHDHEGHDHEHEEEEEEVEEEETQEEEEQEEAGKTDL